MRNAFLLAVTLVSAGCSYRGSLCYQPAVFAGMPAADGETLYRVCGGPRRTVVPAVVERGDVWPQAPERVPTSLDLLRQTAPTGPAGPSQASRHARGYGLCRPIARPAGAVAGGTPAAPPGVALGLCYAPVVHGAVASRDGPA